MKKFLFTACIAAALGLMSCDNKELCLDHNHTGAIDVVFDWSEEPDADPASMNVYFIPEGGGTPIRYQFVGREGGRANIPLGHYDVICVNGDSETNTVENPESWNDFRVTTLVTSFSSFQATRGPEPPRADGTESERVANTPDRLWSGSTTGIHLFDPKATYTVTLTPVEGVCRYTVTVKNIDNLDATTAVSGSLTSMAGGYHAGPGKVSDELVTVSFDFLSDRVSSVNTAFKVFGHCPERNEPHYLTVYALMTDGSRYYRTFDVSDQIHNAPDQRNVDILIDGLELPKPIPSEGGFAPDVSEWEDAEDIYITL